MRASRKSGALLLSVFVLIALPAGNVRAQETHDHLVVQCVEIPPGQKRPDYGCWVIATAHALTFSEPSIYWHLRKFPSREAADASKTPAGFVGEVDGQVWVANFGPREMTLTGGEKVATVGPL